MKPLVLIALLFTVMPPAPAQTGTTAPEPSSNACTQLKQGAMAGLQYRYIDASQTHDFSGNWDFDGDGRADGLHFAGTGGAHLYYYLRLALSSHQRTYRFSFISIDMPCPGTVEEVKADTAGMRPFPQFAAGKLIAGDTADYIYIQLDRYAAIPARLKNRGISSRRLLISCRRGRVKIRDFKTSTCHQFTE